MNCSFNHCNLTFFFIFFFFNDTSTTDIYTLSLHDALPIWKFPFYIIISIYFHPLIFGLQKSLLASFFPVPGAIFPFQASSFQDRKSTRLNSSHVRISYAVFCLKKKKKLGL